MQETSLSETLAATQLTTALPLPQYLPTTLTRSYRILGIETDSFCQVFQDRLVVGVSQLDGKIGTYILCQAMQSQVNPTSVDFTLTTVLGNREDAMLGVYARRLTERVLQESGSTTHRKGHLSILLGISLKEDKKADPDMFRDVVEVLVELVREALQGTTSTTA